MTSVKSNRATCLALVSAAAVLGLLAPHARAQCPGGEAPSDFCTTARVLNGQAGIQFVVMNTANATGSGESSCSIPVGHTVWFSIVPSVSGVLTFSTCHPLTTYDTVAEMYSYPGDCEFISSMGCNDDSASAECNNGCSAYGSVLRYSVTAGQGYRIRVGSYNNNSAGCNLCLGVVVSLCSGETTPPETTITAPASLACVCPGLQVVTGSVSDGGSGVASYVLDFAPVAGGGWTTIARGMGNVLGNLGQWDATGLTEGDYYLRLTARDGCANIGTALRTVHVDAAFDSFALRSPTAGAILGGTVVADGTIWDHCPPGQLQVFWSPALLPVLIPFTTTSPPWVVNDPLGTWNTRLVADGAYVVRAAGTNQCGISATAFVDVTIDNTPPTTVITSPLSCQPFTRGILPIRGTVNDANLASWALYYTGGDAHGWVTIASGASPIINGPLANWDTHALRWCEYTLRLVATDAAVLDGNGALHNQSEYTTSLYVGCWADTDGSGSLSVQDIFNFLNAWFAGCP